jgi:hypothetical protein
MKQIVVQVAYCLFPNNEAQLLRTKLRGRIIQQNAKFFALGNHRAELQV